MQPRTSRTRPFSTRRASALLDLVLFLMPLSAIAPPSLAQEPKPPAALTEAELTRLVAEMQREVETLRGWKYKYPVKASLYTLEELREFVRADSLRTGDGWGEGDRRDAAMKMIGLLPPDCDPSKVFEEAMTGFVPGIYDHRTKTLGVVKREGTDFASLHVLTIIAHELTHALDDQYFDLEKPLSQNASLDAGFAVGAVVEGSAVTLQERYQHKAKRAGNYDPAELQEARKKEFEQMQTLLQAPPFVRTYFIARFPNGIRFLQRGDMRGFTSPDGPGCVGDAVRAALTDPPRSSEQILHPEKYWQDESRDEPIVVNDQDMEKLLESVGLCVVHKDTIGELLCAILTSPEDEKFNPLVMMTPGGWTTAAATGWGGDRFFLLTAKPLEEDPKQKPDKLAGVWLTMWDTPDDCDEFIDGYEIYRESPSRVLVRLDERGVAFLYGVDGGQRSGVTERLRAAPPRFTRGRKPWSLGSSPH